ALEALSVERLLPLTRPPVPARLFEGVLRAEGELESRTLVANEKTFRVSLRREVLDMDWRSRVKCVAHLTS
ncbi:hypothetical protein Taro_043728, partial [Colocasia esculenta]|nr:hypothetical protein [Colocasia esculenta]